MNSLGSGKEEKYTKKERSGEPHGKQVKNEMVRNERRETEGGRHRYNFV